MSNWPQIVDVNPSELDAEQRRWLGPEPLPEGYKITRCTGCGETRVERPRQILDTWKKHFDYCPGVEGEEEERGGRMVDEERFWKTRRAPQEWDRATLEARSKSFDRVTKLALDWQQEDPNNPRLHALWTAINGVPWEPENG